VLSNRSSRSLTISIFVHNYIYIYIYVFLCEEALPVSIMQIVTPSTKVNKAELIFITIIQVILGLVSFAFMLVGDHLLSRVFVPYWILMMCVLL
jgi:hypothetical protein